MAPAAAVTMSFDSLTPGQIARTLEHAGTHPAAVTATFHGEQVIKLSAGGSRFYITTASPHRLIHIDGGNGAASYSFDVTPLTAGSIGPVMTTLHDDVNALRGAADPSAIVIPVSVIHFDNCSTDAVCVVSAKVTVTTDPASSPVIVTMTVGFSGSQHGTPFATCTGTVPAAALATVSPKCQLNGAVWTGWCDSHANPNTGFCSVWANPDYAATVNSASDISSLQSEITQQQPGG
jgi:hypothetical protein